MYGLNQLKNLIKITETTVECPVRTCVLSARWQNSTSLNEYINEIIRLMQISFKTFRHWKGTTEQHKTKDPWHVKLLLGHKSIKSTETYIHYEKMIYQGEANDQFIVKVADTLDDAVKLMEVGFEYHAEVEGHKLFRKRR